MYKVLFVFIVIIITSAIFLVITYFLLIRSGKRSDKISEEAININKETINEYITLEKKQSREYDTL